MSSVSPQVSKVSNNFITAQGLSVGVIVGICVGVLLLAVGMAFVVYRKFFIKKAEENGKCYIQLIQ